MAVKAVLIQTVWSSLPSPEVRVIVLSAVTVIKSVFVSVLLPLSSVTVSETVFNPDEEYVTVCGPIPVAEEGEAFSPKFQEYAGVPTIPVVASVNVTSVPLQTVVISALKFTVKVCPHPFSDTSKKRLARKTTLGRTDPPASILIPERSTCFIYSGISRIRQIPRKSASYFSREDAFYE